MAIIDYHSIKSLIFAKLTRASRILISVLSCLCDDWDGSLSPEHSKHSTLALYSGLGVASIKRALKELQEKDIITIKTQSGRPASIIYNPAAKLSVKTSKVAHSELPLLPKVAHSELPLLPKVAHSELPRSEKIPPQTPIPTGQSDNGKILALNDSPKSLKNRQQPVSIVEKVGKNLVKVWQYNKGADFVRSVLLNMEKKNGEIMDYPGYFISCCRNDWIPTSKKAEREAATEAAREERNLYEESERQRWERIRKSVITEQADPDAQERIKAVQANFWSTMGEPEQIHNPPA